MGQSQSEINSVVAIILWSAPAAFGLSLWFITRFVKHHDSFRESMTEEVKKQADAVSETSKKMHEAVTSIEKQAAEITQSNLTFQNRISVDLLSIERRSIKIEVQLDSTMQKAMELEKEFGGLKNQVTELSQSVEKSRQTTGLAAQLISKHDSEIKKITETLVRVQTRKPG